MKIDFTFVVGIFTIIAAIPVILLPLGVCGKIYKSWLCCSAKEKELLGKMHNGNGEIAVGRGSCDHNGERKGISILYANGSSIYEPKGTPDYNVYKNYEEALAKLKKKGFVDSRRGRLGDDYYFLTPKGTMTKKYY